MIQLTIVKMILSLNWIIFLEFVIIIYIIYKKTENNNNNNNNNANFNANSNTQQLLKQKYQY